MSRKKEENFYQWKGNADFDKAYASAMKDHKKAAEKKAKDDAIAAAQRKARIDSGVKDVSDIAASADAAGKAGVDKAISAGEKLVNNVSAKIKKTQSYKAGKGAVKLMKAGFKEAGKAKTLSGAAGSVLKAGAKAGGTLLASPVGIAAATAGTIAAGSKIAKKAKQKAAEKAQTNKEQEQKRREQLDQRREELRLRRGY